MYNREIEWGLRLHDEYLDFLSKTLDSQSDLLLGIEAHTGYKHYDKFYINTYINSVRKKYWSKLFVSPEFIAKMTSNLLNQYRSQIDNLVKYDFSYYNIKTIQIEIAKNLVSGVEECILKLFDRLSVQHAYDDDLKNNVHYYDGWKTNKCWKINKRVILPIQTWNSIFGKFDYYHVREEIADIEKVFNYLDNGETAEVDLAERLKRAEKNGETKKIPLKYFTLTIYKKGTCHIEFTNERLLKKFNIFGSQKKGWLPKGYAKRKYQDMTAEEKHVIDSFEGEKSYEETQAQESYFIFDTSRPMFLAIA